MLGWEGVNSFNIIWNIQREIYRVREGERERERGGERDREGERGRERKREGERES